jgi:signal transduction histidine kinase
VPFRHRPSPARPESGSGRHAKWYLLYYVLAALDIATVLACLVLNHLIMQIYTDSVAVNERWQKREDSYAALSRLAHAVNAPGNDVFDSHNVATETARLEAALGEFKVRFKAVRADTARSMQADHADVVLRNLDAIDGAMGAMVGEAELIFSHFENGRPERAGERMATMDRKFANVNGAFASLFADVRTILHLNFEQQLAAADLIKRLEYVVVALALMMIAGALYYGGRLYRAARAADAERADHMAALDRARAEAHAANEAKSKFLALMSHEIRTPLNSIFLALDTLQNPRDRAEARSHVAMAQNAGRSLQRLVDELLDLSRIDAGKLEFECVQFDLRRLLDELLASHARRAQTKQVSLTIRVATEVPSAVKGDPLRFGQLVANLVDNAVKFTKAGSVEVSLALRARDAAGPHQGQDSVPLLVTVRDTGIGVKPDQQARIFEDFVQGDDATARTEGGAGLGLAIVRRLVTLMKGRVGFCDTPGGGATFWLELDLAAGHPALPPSSPPGAGMAREDLLAGRRVLVVEDAPEGRTLAAAVLGQLGMNVDVAADGSTAVAAAAATRYDAIFMDIGLPGMDGLQATRSIRAREQNGHEVPIIGLSARVTGRTFDECLDVGMDDCLAKPVTRDSLATALRRWIEA